MARIVNRSIPGFVLFPDLEEVFTLLDQPDEFLVPLIPFFITRVQVTSDLVVQDLRNPFLIDVFVDFLTSPVQPEQSRRAIYEVQFTDEVLQQILPPLPSPIGAYDIEFTLVNVRDESEDFTLTVTDRFTRQKYFFTL